jgi:hypothetical protein
MGGHRDCVERANDPSQTASICLYREIRLEMLAKAAFSTIPLTPRGAPNVCGRETECANCDNNFPGARRSAPAMRAQAFAQRSNLLSWGSEDGKAGARINTTPVARGCTVASGGELVYNPCFLSLPAVRLGRCHSAATSRSTSIDAQYQRVI